MSAFADLNEVVNRKTGGNSGAPEDFFWSKDARVAGAAAAATVANRMTSLWLYDGTPGAGVNPTTVAAPTNATAGSLQQTDPAGGLEKWILGCAAVAAQGQGTLILYDRLLHIGGLSGTTTSAQTVGGSLTRNTGGVGNQIWVEVYTQIGATGTTITASYTNAAGTSGRTTAATSFGNTGFREAQRILELPLASGDTGVQACASVTVLATTGTAGNFGVTIARPLLIIPCGTAGVGGIRNLLAESGPIKCDTGACLALAWYAMNTTAPRLMCDLHFASR